MSYINMDHAGWVESQIAAMKRYKMTKRDRDAAAEHKGWHAAPDKLNDFQRRSFNILGIVGNGIYNAPIAWGGVVWAPWYLIVPWRHNMATWDFQQLTSFVFLCHDARIRGDISPGGPRLLSIALHQRTAAGGIATRHPNLAEAVEAHRQAIRLDHPIMYREKTESSAA